MLRTFEFGPFRIYIELYNRKKLKRIKQSQNH